MRRITEEEATRSECLNDCIGWEDCECYGEYWSHADVYAIQQERDRLREAMLSVSVDLVDATYEDKPEHIKQFVHYALNKLGSALEGGA